ncbi:MAG: extracellular solute-binding protein [Bifidobacteriaceae bacterium]|jgi:multiple sugar transport system substrate-binding protein|nr:extracellular solute-binding protein [Bifidobacteriaceae bacterium]
MIRKTLRGKLAVVAAISALGLVMAGCGGDSSSGDGDSTATSGGDTSTTDTGTTDTTDTTDTGDTGDTGEEVVVPEGATEVVFWMQHFQDAEDAWYKSQVDAFNASQSAIFVNLEVVPADAWDQKLTAAQASGTAPDVYTRAYNQIATLATQGLIQDMKDLIPAESWADLQENVLAMVTVDGGYYAYPLLVEPSMVLFYRTDLVEAAGLDPASPPKTFDELVEWARALKPTLPEGAFALGLAQNATEMSWTTWGIQYGLAGHLMLNGDWSEGLADDEAFAPLFELYSTLYSEGLIPKQALAGYTDAVPYGEGNLAMMINGSWASGQLINEYPDSIANTAVAKVPLATDSPDKASASLGGWTLVLDAMSDAPQESAEFINYIYGGDPQVISEYFKTTQYSKMSPRKSVAEVMAADPNVNSVNPFSATITADIVPSAIAEAQYPWDISMAFGTQLEAAMLEGKDAAACGADAQSAIVDLIDQLGIAGTGPGE